MVLGMTLYGAARSALGETRQPARLGPAFWNACLGVLVMVGSVLASEPSAPPQAPSGEKALAEGPQYLPPYEPLSSESVASAPALPKETLKIASKPAPASVPLPPIAASSDSGKHPPSTAPWSGPATSLLEPPPPISSAPRPPVETTLDIVVGQPHLLTFPDVPQRVCLVVSEKAPLATLQEVPHRAREWYLIGKKPGTTFLDVWLPDPTSATSHRVLHYLVRIRGEGDEGGRSEPQTTRQTQHAGQALLGTLYEMLEQEINRTFPDSTVHLKLMGDALAVSGSARNVFEATRILAIARENAPGARSQPGSGTGRANPSAALPSLQDTLDNYGQAGGSHVINLLRIPGEQQIMLRVVVAEVNRAAARSLGLDFGIGEKQATVLSSRPAAADGSSTLLGNGWIGQALHSLQELHYARMLAEPTLTTLNGQPARFQVGGEFPVPVVTTTPGGAVRGIRFRSYGVRLSMQPVIAAADRIRLSVEAEVSDTDPHVATDAGGTIVPGLKLRNFQSTVELREGETLAVAGLVRDADHAPAMATSQAPPSDRELVVLISPLLLHPPRHETALPRSSPLNPQDIELYLRSGKTLLPRADSLFLIGPQGYTGAPRR